MRPENNDAAAGGFAWRLAAPGKYGTGAHALYITVLRGNDMLIVVAGLIYCRDKVLVAQRKLNDSCGGKWEFPGGKVEYGETPEQAIARELKEELDISPEIDAVCDAQISWNLSGGITLLLCRGRTTHERLSTLECQAARFVYPRELIRYDLLPMDREFAKRQGLIK